MVKYDIPQRYIRKNHNCSIPTRILYLDTETKIEIEGPEQHHTMRLGWSCYVNTQHNPEKPREQWREWYYNVALCDYIESLCFNKSPLYLFGHNIYFDLQAAGFFHIFPLKGWHLDFVYDKGMSFILCVFKEKRQLKILSSTNYFTCSLATLGDMIGIKKGSPDFNNVSDKELSPYCKNDVLILKKAMEYYYDFVTDNDLGRFAMTKSSQAFNAFRHRFMYHKIGVHQDKKIISLERAAYHGGRTECFRFGYMPPVAYCTLDVNSMYAYVMSSCKLPTRCIDFIENPSFEKLNWLVKRFGVIGECFIDTDDPAYAVKLNKKTCFPVGRFKAFLCTEGIRYALEHAHLVNVTQLAVYEKEIIFKRYVDYFYALRKKYDNENRPVMSLLCKYLLNSLYGKFGQRVPIEERETDTKGKGYYRLETLNLVTGEELIEYKLFNTICRQVGLKEGKNTFVAIPAHITEYARFKLYDLIKKGGRDNVYYVDTDSLKMPVYKTGAILNEIDPEKLGALKIEDTFQTFVINGNKNYRSNLYRRTKGIPQKAEMLNTVTWKYNTFLRSPSHQEKQVDDHFIVAETLKQAIPFYDKGIVGPGGVVTPIFLRDF